MEKRNANWKNNLFGVFLQMIGIVRTVLLYACIVIVSILATLLGFLAYEAIQNPPRHGNYAAFKRASEFFSGQKQNTFFAHDPDLGMYIVPFGKDSLTLAPGVENHYAHGRFGNRVSSRGASGDLHSKLVIVGDSFAWGHGVDASDTFADKLASSLGVSYLNLAVSGGSTVTSLVRLNELPGLKPRTIVYALYEDHLYRNVRPCSVWHEFLCIRNPIVHNRDDSYVVRKPADAWWGIEDRLGGPARLLTLWYAEQYEGSPEHTLKNDMFWTAVKLYNRLIQLVFDPDPSSRHEYVLRALDFSIEGMARYAHERGSRFVVVWIPVYKHPEPHRLIPSDVLSILKGHGATVVDMAPILNALQLKVAGRNKMSPFYIPNDGHTNALGHSVIASALLSVLVERQ